MKEFWNALELDTALRKEIDPYIDSLMKIPIEKLISHGFGGNHWQCPICQKPFDEKHGIKAEQRFFSHFRWRANRWEFYRLINTVEKMPNKFYYLQHDFVKEEESGKLRNMVRHWVTCAKILNRINPRTWALDETEFKEVQSVLYPVDVREVESTGRRNARITVTRFNDEKTK